MCLVSLTAQAGPTTTVLASCHDEGAADAVKLKSNPAQFVDYLKKSGLPNTAIGTANVSCGANVAMMGVSSPYHTSNFFSLEIADADLHAYLSKNPNASLADYLTLLQKNFGAGCDILVPVQFSNVKDSLIAQGLALTTQPPSRARRQTIPAAPSGTQQR
jgi:hypothetical protein